MYSAWLAARMTGVSESDLLIWERRYELPVSTTDEATEITLYFEWSVELVRWLATQVENGFTVPQLILLLRASGRLPPRTKPGQ